VRTKATSVLFSVGKRPKRQHELVRERDRALAALFVQESPSDESPGRTTEVARYFEIQTLSLGAPPAIECLSCERR
jgi:hypothetical protein